ncbi:hypothetical protein PAAL109150_26015 [Paenibacillus alkaliterrae]
MTVIVKPYYRAPYNNKRMKKLRNGFGSSLRDGTHKFLEEK